MRTASGPLTTLLNSNLQLAYADLFTFLRVNPTTLQETVLARYTNADKALVSGGNVFVRGPLIKRNRTRLNVGITTDSLDVTVSADATTTINSVPFMQFIAQGGLDGCRLRLERAFMPDWSSPITGTVLLFAGRISDISTNRYEAAITVMSDLELLDSKVPRNLYQPACMNTLYDAGCGKNKVALTQSGTVQASPTPTKSVFNTNLGANPTGYFDLGVVTFTSGLNNGVARTVKQFTTAGPNLVSVIAPFPFAIAAGDTFTIYPGCDKTMSTCTSRFSNLARFRGVPFIPVPETVT